MVNNCNSPPPLPRVGGANAGVGGANAGVGGASADVAVVKLV